MLLPACRAMGRGDKETHAGEETGIRAKLARRKLGFKKKKRKINVKRNKREIAVASALIHKGEDELEGSRGSGGLQVLFSFCTAQPFTRHGIRWR